MENAPSEEKRMADEDVDTTLTVPTGYADVISTASDFLVSRKFALAKHHLPDFVILIVEHISP